jgi:hypothetical protein
MNRTSSATRFGDEAKNNEDDRAEVVNEIVIILAVPV